MIVVNIIIEDGEEQTVIKLANCNMEENRREKEIVDVIKNLIAKGLTNEDYKRSKMKPNLDDILK